MNAKIQILDRFQTKKGATTVSTYFGCRESTTSCRKKNEKFVEKEVLRLKRDTQIQNWV